MFDLIRDTKPIAENEATAMFDRYADAIARAEAADGVDGVIDLACICSGTVRVHDGSLELDELCLRADGPSLFVDGDLKVRGLIEQEFRAGFLVVFGNLEARDIATTAEIFVTGDLTVHGTLFGNCTNYDTSVLGHTRSQVIVSVTEHYFCLYGGRTVGRIVDVYGDTPNLDDRTDGEDALVDGIDGGFNQRAVSALLRGGGSILR
jgi:hypothetical protein